MSLDVEYAIKKDIRNNPIVREIDREQRREFLRTVGIAGLIVVMLLFSAWQHYKIVATGYQVESLRQEQAREMELNRQLRLDLEAMRRPQEIERRALEELQMQPASPANTIVIERVPARPANAARGIIAEHR
jgi:hypothetical protein